MRSVAELKKNESYKIRITINYSNLEKKPEKVKGNENER